MKEKKELLKNYIISNVAPILTNFDVSKLPYAVVIPANISKSELCGHYDNDSYVAPEWFKKLNAEKSLLVIDRIDTISKEEQLKFIELLESKQISTFKLPSNVVIILVYQIIMNLVLKQLKEKC